MKMKPTQAPLVTRDRPVTGVDGLTISFYMLWKRNVLFSQFSLFLLVWKMKYEVYLKVNV